jgi:beta-glucosidase
LKTRPDLKPTGHADLQDISRIPFRRKRKEKTMHSLRAANIVMIHLAVTTQLMAAPCSSDKVAAFRPPIGFEEADRRAQKILDALSLDDKITLIGGYSRFFIHALPEHNVPYIFLSDATQGIRLSARIEDSSIVKPLERSTAFPCPILLASTWNPALAREYARAVGEEARAAGVGFLLGPGFNLYRHSQAGRNFEYFGEDPYLVSRMIESYVIGAQSTGTAVTLKHFIANNTDFYRRRSNSIVDERALNEIYLPSFKAGVDAGAMAVMTSYNKLNGEWCGQSSYAINELLRGQLGFKWLVMTDWTSVYDGEKVAKSGQDLEMPKLEALASCKQLLAEGKIEEKHIDRMAKSILRASIAMGLHDRTQQDLSLVEKFPEHVSMALAVAREGVVLLKNDGNVLPLSSDSPTKIVAAGKYLRKIATGGGAATVKGYDEVTLAQALTEELGGRIELAEADAKDKIAAADVVLLSIGTFDSEGWDRPFDLPEEEARVIDQVLDWNKNTVLIVSSGSGVNLAKWADKAPAILYAWYGGQVGARAVAEIVAGKVNPSGKLPITIEKSFADSPGAGYIPEGERLYTGWAKDNFTRKEYDVTYSEGVFVGYRWYEHKNIEPLFPFGHGLSYSSFGYSDLKLSADQMTADDTLIVSFKVKNVGKVAGAEIAQLYVEDVASFHLCPKKELKGFCKVKLAPQEEAAVAIALGRDAFSYWNPDTRQWQAEPGEFVIHVGGSSKKIALKGDFSLTATK